MKILNTIMWLLVIMMLAYLCITKETVDKEDYEARKVVYEREYEGR